MNGWAIGADGDGGSDGDHATAVYDKLEATVPPLYHADPGRWRWMMKQAIGNIAYYFNLAHQQRRTRCGTSRKNADGSMKRRVLGLLAISLLALGGCALFRPTLEEQGIVKIEIRGTDSSHFVSAHAYVDEPGFTLIGTVCRPGIGGIVPIMGHIDVSVRTPDGREEATNDVPLREHFQPHKERRATFRISYPNIPPRNTILIVVYDREVHT